MLKVFEAFAGYGSQRMALRNLGIEHEVVAISEFDKYADASYQAIHGETWNMDDITKINVDDVPDHDLFTYSFPCFTKDNLVLTEEGYKPINEVTVGDKVLTHNNTYEKVVKTFDNGVQPTVKVKAMGVDEIVTTPNHKFYVREKYREWNNDRRSYDRLFKEPQWKEVKDVTKDYYLGMAVNQKSEIPKWNGITFHWSDGRKPRHKNELQDLMDNKDFWWLIGRYLADGWTRTQGGIVFGIGKNKASEFENRLGKLFNYSAAEEKSVVKYHVPLKELGKFVEQFGKGATNKKLSKSVLNLPIDLLESFIEGYFSGDGSFVNGYWKANSVSRELMLGIGQAVMKVYKRPYSLHKDIRPKTTVIEGRTVNQKDTYSLSFKKEAKKQDNAFYEDGYVWIPFNTIEDADNENVYDIEVNNAHSFTVQNVIVHNCQDISVAGKGKGFSKDSGTRSGLLWESERIIKAKKPKYLLMENVKNLISEKFMPGFVEWILALEELGYSNYYEVLNAKDFGIPQNRERVFMVSILGEHEPYVFPKPIKLEKRLKDVLEEEVDERYYLDDERAQQLIATITDSNEIGYVPYKEGGKQHQSNTVYDKEKVAPTIEARDYKGAKQILEPEIKQIGQHNTPTRENSSRYRTYGTDGLSPALTAAMGEGGNTQPFVPVPKIAASRGRGKNNEQQLEVNKDETSNALTTVEKDNYVVEPLGTLASGASEQFGVGYMEGLSKTLKANKHDISVLEGIPIKNATKKGYLLATDGDGIDLGYASMNTRRGRVQKDMSQTLTTDDSKGVVERKEELSDGLKETYTIEILQVLQRENGEEEISKWANRGLEAIHKQKVLRHRLYEERLGVGQNKKIQQQKNEPTKRKAESGVLHDTENLSGLQLKEKLGRTSQRQESIQQFARELGTFMQELPPEKAQSEKEMHGLWETTEGIGILQQALFKIQKIWRPELYKKPSFRIRKLSPLECWRLMDVTDEDFYKAQAVNSNSQLYKQAGNSIVVSVLEAIFRNMFLDVPEKDLIGEHIPLF